MKRRWMAMVWLLAIVAALGFWFAGRSALYEQQREALVRHLEASGIRAAAVLAAIGRVERHRFVAAPLAPLAYQDSPLPIGEGQTISQPAVVALMTEKLQLAPGEKVLEVGTGSGYQAAILAELGCKVWSIEIVPSLAKVAAARLKELGYGSIQVRIGDGYLGWPEAAPFDAVIVTCAPDHIPKPLVSQLRDGGRMCIPIGPQDAVQFLTMIRKKGDRTEIESSIPVRFVPLVRAR